MNSTDLIGAGKNETTIINLLEDNIDAIQILSNCEVKNITFKGFKSISIFGKNNHFESNRIIGGNITNDDIGIEVQNCEGVYIEHNIFEIFHGIGVQINYSSDINLIGNSYVGEQGFLIQNSWNGIIENNNLSKVQPTFSFSCPKCYCCNCRNISIENDCRNDTRCASNG